MPIVIDFNTIANEDDWKKCQQQVQANLQAGFQRQYNGDIQGLPEFLYQVKIKVTPPQTSDYDHLPSQLTLAQARQQIAQQQQYQQMYRQHHRVTPLLDNFFDDQLLVYLENFLSISEAEADDILTYCNQDTHSYGETIDAVNDLTDLFSRLHQDGLRLVDSQISQPEDFSDQKP